MADQRGKEKLVVRNFRELDVYRLSFDTAMEIFTKSRDFPPEEKYSLADRTPHVSRPNVAVVLLPSFFPQGGKNVSYF